MTTQIEICNLSLKFKNFNNPTPTLKDSLVSIFSPKNKVFIDDEFYALRDISLNIVSGERVGLIGLNGAGKSTLLKVVAGIYPPTSGLLKITGNITPMIELGTGMDMELSGRENIYLNGSLLGYSKNDMKQREQAVIDFSELSEFIDMPVKYYSTGMYSRLVFSISTMINPEILIIDEIFSAGDAHFVEKATRRMEALLDQSQIVLFVSHSLSLVKRICNRVLVMHHGIILNDGEPDAMITYYEQGLV